MYRRTVSRKRCPRTQYDHGTGVLIVAGLCIEHRRNEPQRTLLRNRATNRRETSRRRRCAPAPRIRLRWRQAAKRAPPCSRHRPAGAQTKVRVPRRPAHLPKHTAGNVPYPPQIRIGRKRPLHATSPHRMYPSHRRRYRRLYRPPPRATHPKGRLRTAPAAS